MRLVDSASAFTGSTSYKENGKTVNVNIQTNIQYRLVEKINNVRKGENIMFIVDNILPMPGDLHPGANPIGRASSEGNVMAVEYAYKNNLSTIWHEIGHNLGFYFGATNPKDSWHSPKSNSLMYKNTGSTKIDSEDLVNGFSDVIRRGAGTYYIEGSMSTGDVQTDGKKFLKSYYKYDQKKANQAGL